MSEVIIRKQVNRFILGEAWACFFLRMFVGMRLMFAGLTKFKWTGPDGVQYKFNEASPSMDSIRAMMSDNTLLGQYPAVLDAYSSTLPWILIGVGAWVISGWFTRMSLIAAGGTFLSLALGLMMLPDDNETVYRGIELLCVAGALCLVRYNILAMDNLWDIVVRKKDAPEVIEEKGESSVDPA
ncbi:MAG: hypothetical protein AAGJ79_15520 [Verrucomicrobiota bacterium]